MQTYQRWILTTSAFVAILALGAAGCGKKKPKGETKSATAAWLKKPLKSTQGTIGKTSFSVKLPEGLSPAKKSELTHKWWPAGKDEFEYPGFEISTATGFIRADSPKVVREALEKDKDNKVLKCVAVDGGILVRIEAKATKSVTVRFYRKVGTDTMVCRAFWLRDHDGPAIANPDKLAGWMEKVCRTFTAK